MTICLLCEIREVKDTGMLCEHCRTAVDTGKLDQLLTDALPLDPRPFVRMPDKEREPDLTDYQINFINHSKGQCPYCEFGNLIVGPMAGQTNLNCRCDDCKLECGIFTWQGQVIHGSKIVREEPLDDSFYPNGALKDFLK